MATVSTTRHAFERTMHASQKMLRAAAKGDIRTLEEELLVEHHVDSLESGGNGHSSLHAASEAGQEECVRWLIENGCDVNVVSTKHRHTPLHIAGSAKVALALLEAGASTGAKDKMRQTPLQRFSSIKMSGDKATRLLAQQISEVLAAWVPSAQPQKVASGNTGSALVRSNSGVLPPIGGSQSSISPVRTSRPT